MGTNQISIDAPNQEEAMAKAISLMQGDVIIASNLDKQICIENIEFLFDTAEALPMEHNDGNPTKEIFMSAPHQDKMITNNV